MSNYPSLVQTFIINLFQKHQVFPNSIFLSYIFHHLLRFLISFWNRQFLYRYLLLFLGVFFTLILTYIFTSVVFLFVAPLHFPSKVRLDVVQSFCRFALCFCWIQLDTVIIDRAIFFQLLLGSTDLRLCYRADLQLQGL